MIDQEQINEVVLRFGAAHAAESVLRANALADYLHMSDGKPYKRSRMQRIQSTIGQFFIRLAHSLGEYE